MHARSGGVVVITSALHADGREFDPRPDLSFFKTILRQLTLTRMLRISWTRRVRKEELSKRCSTHEEVFDTRHSIRVMVSVVGK